MQGNFHGNNILKDCLTLALAINTTCIANWNVWLFTNLYTQYALEGGYQQIMCGGSETKWYGWHWCIWELDDEPRCTFQISKIEGILNYFVTYSLKQDGRGESFGFSTLQLSNIIIIVLPPHVTSGTTSGVYSLLYFAFTRVWYLFIGGLFTLQKCL